MVVGQRNGLLILRRHFNRRVVVPKELSDESGRLKALDGRVESAAPNPLPVDHVSHVGAVENLVAEDEARHVGLAEEEHGAAFEVQTLENVTRNSL